MSRAGRALRGGEPRDGAPLTKAGRPQLVVLGAAAKDLAQDAAELTPDEKATLTAAVDDPVKGTPRTQVAAR